MRRAFNFAFSYDNFSAALQGLGGPIPHYLPAYAEGVRPALEYLAPVVIGADPVGPEAVMSRADAWLQGRDYVDPEDVRAIVNDVLRHRLMLSYEAQGEGVSADKVIAAVVEHVALP